MPLPLLNLRVHYACITRAFDNYVCIMSVTVAFLDFPDDFITSMDKLFNQQEKVAGMALP